jgi:ATP-dependent helicase HepA
MLTRFGKLPPESLRGVFNRTAALRQPGVRLFRLGNPFISGLAKVIDVDERGQASAMFRRARTSDPLPYFGFDLLIEADLTSAVERLEGEGERALRRYADALLPPTLARVWLKVDETEFIRDGKLLSWLNREYDERDVNLGSRTDILADVFGGFDRFARQARAAEKTAVETFANEEWLRNRAERAHADARQILTIRRAQAEARQAAGRLVTDTESYLLDMDVHEAVVNALQQPTIRVVSVSCVIDGQWTNDR